MHEIQQKRMVIVEKNGIKQPEVKKFDISEVVLIQPCLEYNVQNSVSQGGFSFGKKCIHRRTCGSISTIYYR